MITVQELMDFLSFFEPDADVLINVDSSTPDPCDLPDHMEKFYTLQDPHGNTVEVGEDMFQDYLDEGFVIVKIRPLLWPA